MVKYLSKSMYKMIYLNTLDIPIYIAPDPRSRALTEPIIYHDIVVN